MYVCSKCGKLFDRKKAFTDTEVLCNGCLISKRKKEEFQKSEKKQLFLERTRATCQRIYGCNNSAQSPQVKAKHAHKGGFAESKYQEKIQAAAHSDSAYQKKEQTYTERYGASHFMKSEEGYKRYQDGLMAKTGYRNPMQNPETQSNNSRGYLFEGVHFDSSWELAYFLWLRDNKVDFIYHPAVCIDYVDSDGVSRVYRPDFIINGQLCEIKGDQFFNESGEPYNSYTKKFWWEKYNIMLDNNVKILKFDEVKTYLRYIKTTYGKDYLKQFKIKFNDYRNDTARLQ